VIHGKPSTLNSTTNHKKAIRSLPPKETTMLLRPISFRRTVLCLFLFSLVASLIVPTHVEAFQGAKKETSPEKKPAADPFAVPEGDSKKLLAFVTKIVRLRPRFRTLQEVRDHLSKANTAVGKAVDTIIADKTADEATVTSAVELRFTLLSNSTRFDRTASKAIEDFAKSLETNKASGVVAEVSKQKLLIRIRGVASAQASEKKQLIDDVEKWFGKGKIGRTELGVARGLARGLESPGKMELAAEAYNRFGARFRKSDDAKIALFGEKLEGAARRVQLPGNPIDVQGTTLAGEKFDWSAYKGKVVLIDFWATWCGPCIRELPNVKKNYDLYHDRGFEVVGISLDTSTARVAAFNKKYETSWTILYGQTPESIGWNHPLVVHYGITSIPTVILVDQKGNVVSLNARGPELSRLLEKLIGPPKAVGEEPDSKSTKPASKR